MQFPELCLLFCSNNYRHFGSFWDRILLLTVSGDQCILRGVRCQYQFIQTFFSNISLCLDKYITIHLKTNLVYGSVWFFFVFFFFEIQAFEWKPILEFEDLENWTTRRFAPESLCVSVGLSVCPSSVSKNAYNSWTAWDILIKFCILIHVDIIYWLPCMAVIFGGRGFAEHQLENWIS